MKFSILLTLTLLVATNALDVDMVIVIPNGNELDIVQYVMKAVKELLPPFKKLMGSDIFKIFSDLGPILYEHKIKNAKKYVATTKDLLNQLTAVVSNRSNTFMSNINNITQLAAVKMNALPIANDSQKDAILANRQQLQQILTKSNDKKSKLLQNLNAAVSLHVRRGNSKLGYFVGQDLKLSGPINVLGVEQQVLSEVSEKMNSIYAVDLNAQKEYDQMKNAKHVQPTVAAVPVVK